MSDEPEVTLERQLISATEINAVFCAVCGQPDEPSLHDPARCEGCDGTTDAFPIAAALDVYDRSCSEEPDLEGEARALHCAIIGARVVRLRGA